MEGEEKMITLEQAVKSSESTIFYIIMVEVIITMVVILILYFISGKLYIYPMVGHFIVFVIVIIFSKTNMVKTTLKQCN